MLASWMVSRRAKPTGFLWNRNPIEKTTRIGASTKYSVDVGIEGVAVDDKAFGVGAARAEFYAVRDVRLHVEGVA